MSRIINPLTDAANQKLKNTIDAKQSLENLIIPDDHILISYDVKQLYTSIPQDLAIESLEELLNENPNWKDKTKLKHDDIINLTKLCLKSTVFQFNGKYYKQIQGTPMGSSVSVALAEATMQHVEKEIFKNDTFNILVWKRYVDDVIAVIPREKENDVVTYINSINPHIQFTSEPEQNSKIPYLDLLIERNRNGSLNFSVYRKPTHTNRYLDYHSNHAKHQKLSVVRSLKDRANNLCSDEKKEDELRTIKSSLTKNNFPGPLIKSFIKNRSITNHGPPNDTNRIQYVKTPFINGPSQRVKKIFETI